MGGSSKIRDRRATPGPGPRRQRTPRARGVGGGSGGSPDRSARSRSGRHRSADASDSDAPEDSSPSPSRRSSPGRRGRSRRPRSPTRRAPVREPPGSTAAAGTSTSAPQGSEGGDDQLQSPRPGGSRPRRCRSPAPQHSPQQEQDQHGGVSGPLASTLSLQIAKLQAGVSAPEHLRSSLKKATGGGTPPQPPPQPPPPQAPQPQPPQPLQPPARTRRIRFVLAATDRTGDDDPRSCARVRPAVSGSGGDAGCRLRAPRAARRAPAAPPSGTQRSHDLDGLGGLRGAGEVLRTSAAAAAAAEGAWPAAAAIRLPGEELTAEVEGASCLLSRCALHGSPRGCTVPGAALAPAAAAAAATTTTW